MIEITENFPMQRWETMQTFLAECYRPDLALCALSHFSWQFQADADFANVVCGWDGDELLGICGYIPVKMHWGDLSTKNSAAWPINWIVKPKAPPGLGFLLFRKIQNRFPIVIGSGASSEGKAFYQALKGRYYEHVPRYLCVLNSAKSQPLTLAESRNQLEEWRAPENGDPALFLKQRFQLINGEVSLYQKKEKVLEDSHESIDIHDFRQTERFKKIFLAHYKPDWVKYSCLTFGTVRTINYLMWRYLEHPVFNYHLAIAGEREKPALCVWRVEWTVGEANVPVARMVEFFHPDNQTGVELGKSLLSNILNELKKQGCAYIDFICSSQKIGQTLLETGWLAESGDRMILPVRLTPIEKTLRHQNVEFVVGKEYPKPALESMYITKSDADEDRPVSKRVNMREQKKTNLTFIDL